MISTIVPRRLISARMDAPLTSAEHYELQRHLAVCDSCCAISSAWLTISPGVAAAGAEPGRFARRHGRGPGEHTRLGLVAAKLAGVVFTPV